MPQNPDPDSARSGRGRRPIARLESLFAQSTPIRRDGRVEESRACGLDFSFSKLHISSNKRASSSSVPASSRPAAAASKPTAASSRPAAASSSTGVSSFRRASLSSRPAASSKPVTAPSRPSSSCGPVSSSGRLAHGLVSRLRIRVNEDERLGREQDENVDLENLKTYVDGGSKLSDEEKEAFMNRPRGHSWYQGAVYMSRKEREEEAAEDDEMKEKRKTTNEMCMKRIQHIIDSQGFDIGEPQEVPTSPKIASRVVPVRYAPVQEFLPHLCCEALAKFNTLNKTHFKFKKVVKANTIVGPGYLIFATFQAWMHSHSETFVTFQARGFHDFCYPKERRIDFCRLAKDASGLVEKKVDTKGGEGPVMG